MEERGINNAVSAYDTNKPVQVKKSQPSLDSVRIKKIGILSLSTSLALCSFFIGVLSGLLFSILAAIDIPVYVKPAINPGIIPLDLILGLWSVLILPVVLGILFFIFGALLAAVYNLTAIITRGIELFS